MEPKRARVRPLTDDKSLNRHEVISDAPTTSADARAALQAHAHRICPGCGMELVDRGCKMRCLRCGFFLDCSDG